MNFKFPLLLALLLTISACANNNPPARTSQDESDHGSKVYGSVRYGYQHSNSSSNMKDSGSRIGIKSGNLK